MLVSPIFAFNFSSRRHFGFRDVKWSLNKPFPSAFEPHHESEVPCIVFVIKTSFSYANTDNF